MLAAVFVICLFCHSTSCFNVDETGETVRQSSKEWHFHSLARVPGTGTMWDKPMIPTFVCASLLDPQSFIDLRLPLIACRHGVSPWAALAV
jgi:hypothetical protein